MTSEILYVTSRCVTIKICDGGKYNTLNNYIININGQPLLRTDHVVTTIYNLLPDTDYDIDICALPQSPCQTSLKNNDAYSDDTGNISYSMSFKTEFEAETLNIYDFGAVGDGIHDDTSCIQAAIMSAGCDSRVLIPKGTFLINGIFVKSNLSLEIAKGAIIRLTAEPDKIPVIPGVIENYDEKSERILNCWEGNPLATYAGAINGIGVDNCTIYGEGTVDGQASYDNWWTFDKEKFTIGRPKLLFFNKCDNLNIIGLKLINSPSWTIHPLLCTNSSIYCTNISNPLDSPNTDGLDPECVNYMKIMGMHFSLGDDCVAIKSGKIYIGRKYSIPSENITISNCFMECGHGAVTIGSEMSGGIKNVLVCDSVFKDTDRGLRIKSRRGRGKNAVIDMITFRNIDMYHVLTPFTANEFYFCDPDGKTDYVQNRDKMPVDDRTPLIKHMIFENINARDCEICAAYFLGLPERPIELIEMRNVSVSFKENSCPGMPIMACGIEPVSKQGIISCNVITLTQENVNIS